MPDAFMKRLTEYHSNKTFQKNRFRVYQYAPHDMTFFSTLSSASSQYLSAPLAPSRKRSQQFKSRDDVDEFLSSDLELSFASTMSLNSPSRDYVDLANDSMQDEPMDISPAPPRNTQKENERSGRPLTRPRAFTSAARMFGQDMSNSSQNDNSSFDTKSGAKRIQRSALPTEWLSFSRPIKSENSLEENMFAPVSTNHFILAGFLNRRAESSNSRLKYLFHLHQTMPWTWTRHQSTCCPLLLSQQLLRSQALTIYSMLPSHHRTVVTLSPRRDVLYLPKL